MVHSKAAVAHQQKEGQTHIPPRIPNAYIYMCVRMYTCERICTYCIYIYIYGNAHVIERVRTYLREYVPRRRRVTPTCRSLSSRLIGDFVTAYLYYLLTFRSSNSYPLVHTYIFAGFSIRRLGTKRKDPALPLFLSRFFLSSLEIVASFSWVTIRWRYMRYGPLPNSCYS